MNDFIPLSLPNDADGQQPERSDAVANRARILATAAQLFDAKGPENVSMSDIVKTAGVGRGTLYRHFPSKADLCLALMDAQIREFQDHMLARLRNLAASGASPLSQLDEVMGLLVDFTEEDTPLLLEMERQKPAEFGHKLNAPYQWQSVTVQGLLAAAVTAGELSSAADVDYLTDALLAPLSASIYHQQRVERGFSAERIRQGLSFLVNQLVNS